MRRKLIVFESQGEPRDPVDHLAEAWLRHKWANQAGEAFHRRCVEFTSTDPYLVWARWEAESWELTFQGPRDPAQEVENLTELSRLLGVFLDHARAALNYTAYQVALLAIRENAYLTDPTTPDDQRLKSIPSDFPIYDSQSLYRRDNRLKRLPSKYVDPIKAVQPYNGGHEPLWRLHTLAGEFRHRIVHPAMVWPVRSQHRVFVGGQQMSPSDVESIPRNHVKSGDVILRFQLPDVPPGTPVDPRATLSIGIDHSLCVGREAVGLMNEIIDEVTSVMGGIEAELFGLQSAAP